MNPETKRIGRRTANRESNGNKSGQEQRQEPCNAAGNRRVEAALSKAAVVADTRLSSATLEDVFVAVTMNGAERGA